MTGGLPYEEEYKVTYQTLVPRFVNAWQLDAYESWKVVDEHGYDFTYISFLTVMCGRREEGYGMRRNVS